MRAGLLSVLFIAVSSEPYFQNRLSKCITDMTFHALTNMFEVWIDHSRKSIPLSKKFLEITEIYVQNVYCKSTVWLYLGIVLLFCVLLLLQISRIFRSPLTVSRGFSGLYYSSINSLTGWTHTSPHLKSSLFPYDEAMVCHKTRVNVDT